MDERDAKIQLSKEETEEEEWWQDYFKRKEERDTDDLNHIYKTLLYYIPNNGNVKDYVRNYLNPSQRMVLPSCSPSRTHIATDSQTPEAKWKNGGTSFPPSICGKERCMT